jgi:hypothetical protein
VKRRQDNVLTRALYATDSSRLPASTAGWETLIRHARESQLLGTLEARLSERRLLEVVPSGPRAHLLSGERIAFAQAGVVRRETREIERALRSVGTTVVLLKGAAYLLAKLPCARGRIFSDVDIMVPHAMLPAVEAALMLGGYATTHHHPYDQRYYRKWMHELPPMRHIKRGTVIDVHHTLVPRSSRIALNAGKLFDAAIPLAEHPVFSVLAPPDMVLHSATHLFNNEDMSHALRDLVDLDVLLRHFGADANFWDRLLVRARELDLRRPLYYMLRWCGRLLDTPIPPHVSAAEDAKAPGPVLSSGMDVLLRAALEPTESKRSTRWARGALYVRGHWLKMPMPLLAWHLSVKAFRRDSKPAPA